MGNNDIQIRNSTTEFLVFSEQAGGDGVEVRFENEQIWLTQKMMAKLFDVNTQAITKHLSNIYEIGEADENSTCSKMEQVQIEGNRQVKRILEYYNLDAVISVGYRVNSMRATQFRQWATSVLTTYARQGYIIDKERMKTGAFLGQDYYNQLLADIQEIRLSERRFYQKVTDIYATSIDYNAKSPTTKDFFALVQNKLHWAIHQRTAAEIVVERADATQPNMGLTSWKKGPQGKIAPYDVEVAKNYLSQSELEDLGNLVEAFLDLATDRAKRHIPMTMEDWSKYLSSFIEFADREVLDHLGKVSHEFAKEYALTEFEKYRPIQDANFISDFDSQLNLLDLGIGPHEENKVGGE
jgi:hypothetical protein